MRWRPRRRRERRPAAMPDRSTRLPDGRHVDGDTVRLPGQLRWADLLGPQAAAPDGSEALRRALTEDTALLPIVTPARRWRGRGGPR